MSKGYEKSPADWGKMGGVVVNPSKSLMVERSGVGHPHRPIPDRTGDAAPGSART